MKDGTTHLAYKPEHAVDLDTGVIVAAGSIRPTRVTPRPSPPRWNRPKPCLISSAWHHAGYPAEMIADKGYHSREGLKALEDSAGKAVSPNGAEELRPRARRRVARRAVYNNRARLKSTVARQAFKLRAERSSVPSPSSSTSAACAALGCAAPRTSKALSDPGRGPQPGAGDP